MAIFAVIPTEQITNVIVAETLEIAEMVTGVNCVEIPEGSFAGIGWGYKNNKFIEPLEQNETNTDSVV